MTTNQALALNARLTREIQRNRCARGSHDFRLTLVSVQRVRVGDCVQYVARDGSTGYRMRCSGCGASPTN